MSFNVLGVGKTRDGRAGVGLGRLCGDVPLNSVWFLRVAILYRV